ncbi:nitrate- and nitrite sensing domain-containing protein [Actinomadura rugatobispora]|uniref:histidine kinase n=1 Tax=Actinomadura rugatobispora TaxID=1994 RepID=A0ABW1A9N9_9ACTN|nr:nitrate- and nitrite sensing domain-containing protein [Actinomadura rugatobispora]
MFNAEHVQGSRGRPRTRPIRRRIALLLVIPLTSLVALWVFSASTTLSAALQRLDFATVYDRVGNPLGRLAQTLQDERAAAVALVTDPAGGEAARFRERVTATDTAIAAVRKAAGTPEAWGPREGAAAHRYQDLDRAFGGLAALRSRAGSGDGAPLRLIDEYSEVVTATTMLLTTLTRIDDIAVQQQTMSLLNVYWARDFMLREDLLLSSVQRGRMTAAERAAFARWAGSGREFFRTGLATADGEIARFLGRLTGAPSYLAYRGFEEGVVTGGTVPRAAEWRGTMTTLAPLWLQVSQQAGQILTRRQIEPVERGIMTRFYLAGGVGLLAVVASIVLSLLFARRLADELRTLQRTAQELAHERLPRVVARLRRGERVDVEAEAPRPAAGRTREVALVTDAFAAVQRTAIGTAVGEAELRASINRVFVSLSWRSQSLLHRQLRLLDQMERRASSPEELEALFRLDHLTTRMRRHAEGLVILSGAPTVRAWDHPVAAEDLVRAAIAEVEDYTRVEVAGSSSSAVTGRVVADIIHLLAELIENAAAYSPPTTEVTVKVETVANGLAIEVVDRGVGLHPDERAELNRRLADAAEFDLADADRLGLFVVARLAARHGVQVTLQPSAYGGTTAIVLVPYALVTHDEQRRPLNGAGPEAVARPAEAVPVPAHRLDPPIRPALPGAPVHEPPPPPQVSVWGMPPGGLDRPLQGGPPEPESSEVTGELPRRVRQQHLAPQLRGRPAPRPGRGAAPDDDFDEPSPEVSRDLMSSLQSGWQRGRDDDDPDDNDQLDEWGRS